MSEVLCMFWNPLFLGQKYTHSFKDRENSVHNVELNLS